MAILAAWKATLRALSVDFRMTTRPLCRLVILLYRFERVFGSIIKPWRFLLNNLLLHVEIPARVDVGPGLRLAHPYNIVINPQARIGRGCTLFHGVTLGENEFRTADESGAPWLGDLVYVGAGALLIGKITVGDEAVIAAGAVVTKDVPPRHLVTGINQLQSLTTHPVRDLLAKNGIAHFELLVRRSVT